MDVIEAVQLVEKEIRGKQWCSLARELGICDSTIDSIEHDYRHHGLREIVHRMLSHWMEQEGIQATIEKLAFALVRCSLLTMAVSIYPGSPFLYL